MDPNARTCAVIIKAARLTDVQMGMNKVCINIYVSNFSFLLVSSRQIKISGINVK